jgi:hypothetical protein
MKVLPDPDGIKMQKEAAVLHTAKQDITDNRQNEKKNHSAGYKLAFIQCTGITGGGGPFRSVEGKDPLSGHFFQ